MPFWQNQSNQSNGSQSPRAATKPFRAMTSAVSEKTKVLNTLGGAVGYDEEENP